TYRRARTGAGGGIAISRRMRGLPARAGKLPAHPPPSWRRYTGDCMRKIRVTLMATVALAASNLIAASVAVTPEIATLGFGASVGIGLTPMFGVRVAGHTGSYSHNLRSEEHTSELQSRVDLVCRLLL